MAGSFAHDVHMATGVPYVVESFATHSEYMAECGVWPRFGFRYRVFSMYERRQVEHAHRIITVTHNHRDVLIASGVTAHRCAAIPPITDIQR